jgi:hypothetical protein
MIIFDVPAWSFVFIADLSAAYTSDLPNRIIEHLAYLLLAFGHGNFRGAVAHHPIHPKRGQGMHRAPTEPSCNHDDFLALIVHF